jgi:hypothetical protein
MEIGGTNTKTKRDYGCDVCGVGVPKKEKKEKSEKEERTLAVCCIAIAIKTKTASRVLLKTQKPALGALWRLK